MTWTLVVIALVNGQQSAATWKFSTPYLCEALAKDILSRPAVGVKVTAAYCQANTNS